MKHNYITCDCCGEKIIANGFMSYYKIKHGLHFGPLYFDDGRRVDICNYCWDDIQEYVKEKRNDR